jgi:hypothetical protein
MFRDILHFYSFLFILTIAHSFPAAGQTNLAAGEQPQISVDSRNVVRLVFGDKDAIYYATSNDQGKSFSKPQVIAQLPEMHLGMTRGPQLATSRDFSLVTAIDKTGNIHSFLLTHKTGKWKKLKNVNDTDGSAPEGLMSIAADDKNNFYAVWLDLREQRKNNIAFALLKGNTSWSANKFVYKSAEDHVCECCKPSVAVKGNTVAVMFRNWLRGARDMYLSTSMDGGKTFSPAEKLGHGTWPLKGCPMDGGGLSFKPDNSILTAWQRDGQIYVSEPRQIETRLAEGRGVGLSGEFVTWQKGDELFVSGLNGRPVNIGKGTALKLSKFSTGDSIAVWERDDHILFKKLGALE